MADNTVRFRATLDDKVTGPLRRISDAFDRLGGKGAGASLFGNVGAKAVAKGFSLIETAASSATQLVFDSIDAASALTEATTKSAAVFGPAADNMERWASTASRAFGQSKRSALENAATIGNLVKSFGLADEKAETMSKGIVELASDLASFNNTTTDEALTALRAGLTGEMEPLKRFGVALNEARLKEEAMRLGLIKTATGTLPVAIKTQAAYSLILKDTSIAQGDYARTADGMANQQRRLNALAEDTSAKFGEVLLPVVIEFQSTVIRAMDNASISFDEMSEAAANGSQAAQARLNALGDKAVSTAVLVRSTKDDWAVAEDAIDDVGDASANTAKVVGVSVDQMVGDSRKLRDQWVADAEAILAEYYDPIEARQELLALKHEAADARRVLSSKGASKEEKEAARATLTAVERKTQGIMLELGKAGKATNEEIDKALDVWNRRWATAGAASRREIDRIRRKWLLLKMDITGTLPGRVGLVAPGEENRDIGGRVVPGGVYNIRRNEKLFMDPKGGGYIMPTAFAGAGGETMGGATVVHTKVYLDGRQIAEVTDRHMTYEAARAPQTVMA